MQIRKTFLVVMLLAITACTAIPISTLWKLRDFGKEDLLQIKPEEIRAKIIYNISNTLKTVKLNVKVKHGNGVDSYGIPLEIIEKKQSSIKTRWGNEKLQTENILKLSSEGIKDFYALQSTLHALQSDGDQEYTLSILFSFLEKPTQPEFELSTQIKFHQVEDDVTLIDKMNVRFSENKEAPH